jgi:hypothetical protein
MKLLSSDLNAFAVMLRRAMEALCEDRGVSGSDLQKGLRELANRREIPRVLAEVTVISRRLAGADMASKKMTWALAWDMDSFLEAVVHYVYVAPGKLETFRQRLELYNIGRTPHDRP